jgi:hypothetical protein
MLLTRDEFLFPFDNLIIYIKPTYHIISRRYAAWNEMFGECDIMGKGNYRGLFQDTVIKGEVPTMKTSIAGQMVTRPTIELAVTRT